MCGNVTSRHQHTGTRYGNGARCETNLELVENRSLTSRVEAEHEQPILLAAEKKIVKVVIE